MSHDLNRESDCAPKSSDSATSERTEILTEELERALRIAVDNVGALWSQADPVGGGAKAAQILHGCVDELLGADSPVDEALAAVHDDGPLIGGFAIYFAARDGAKLLRGPR